MANVCLGEARTLMPMDHLPLAAYLAHADATFPEEFGGRVPDLPSILEVSSPESSSATHISTSFQPSNEDRSSQTTDIPGDMSQRCHLQLEL